MMTGNLKHKPTTRRDAADAVRLKAEGDPAHINAHEARLLHRLMPEAAGPVITKGLLAEAGRRGDDRITKLIPAEAALLKSRGGSGTVNPATGLLEYGDGMGGSDNPGGGHNGDGGGGGYGGGYGGGTTSSSGDGGVTGYGADPGIGFGFSPSPGLSYGDISGFGMQDKNTIGPGGDMSNFAGRPGDLSNYGLASEYAPLDTLHRLVQTAIYGPPKQYNPEHVQGRTPTGQDMGLARKAAATLAGPMGPAFSGLMTVGGWMRDSMSPEAQQASMDANQAQGAKNSTGQDNSGRASMAAGSASGASTAAPLAESLRGSQNAGAVPPGYSLNPAGQLIPLPQGNNRPAYQDPIRNLLLDYVMNGRSRGGLLG